jgi:hypothetical protein
VLSVSERNSYDRDRGDLTDWLISNGVVSTFLATTIMAMAVLHSLEFRSVSAITLRDAMMPNGAITGSNPSDCQIMIADAGAASTVTFHARRCTSKYTRQVRHR